MNILLTTCKNRRDHLRSALVSWRYLLPAWVPLVVAVDDPDAVVLLNEVYAELPHLWASESQRGFSRLLAIAAGVRALPPEAETVALFDADLVALVHTGDWLAGDYSRSFKFCGPAAGARYNRDDYGVLVSSASVLRKAFEVLGDVSDWGGYGWEDCLIRCACWTVCNQGGASSAPAAWAHIPHSDLLRINTSAECESLAHQAGRNYRRLMVGLDHLSEVIGTPWRETSIWEDCIPWARPSAA